MQYKLLASVFTLLFSSISGYSQPQLEGAGFETWSNAGQSDQEPVEWSSLKTSDGGFFINSLVPQLCWRSTDAHTGSYSVNLRTVSSTAGTANGLLTNGRVHAELNIANSYMFTDQGNGQWNTPMTSRPDSLVGWFKATPQSGDRANVGALMHVAEGRLPAFGTESNWVAGASWKAPYATVSNWTRFSTPMQYISNVDPEWILLILTAGDSAGSQVGTQAWFDDLALIYKLYCVPSTPVAYVSSTISFPMFIDFSTGGVPVGPTVFTAQLSDAFGSYASPIVIGSVTSALPQGSMPVTIPAGTMPGNGYRVRVVTASPFYASVAADLTIEMATGVSESERSLVRIWNEPNGLVADLRALDPERMFYEIFDMNAGMITSGSLQGGALQRISMNATPGIMVVRLVHGQGTWTGRVHWNAH